MMDKVWKRISDKRPKGAKLIKIVAALSAMVWIAAIAALIVLKDKKPPAVAGGLGSGGAKVTSAAGGEAAAMATVAAAPEGEEGNAVAASAHSDSAAAPMHAAEHPQAQPDAREAENESTDLPPSREEAAALRQVAELFIASGDVRKAVTPMRRVMLRPTRDITLLSMATDIFLGTGNYQEALGTAGQVLALKPDDIHTKVQSAEAQYRLGRVDSANASARALLKDHPGELTMLTLLGTMEVEMGPGHPDYGKSLQIALKLKPDYVPALYLLGRKAQLEGNYKDAETAFRKVVKLEPQNAKAHGQLGMAYYHLGKEKEAEKEYRAELAVNPEDYNTWYNLGELQLSYAAKEIFPNVIQGLRADAMESYLKALDLNPDLAQAHFRVGVLLNGNGQYKEAIRHLQASLKADSRHVPTLVQLSLAFENLKQPERAKEYLTKAYELDPLNKIVLFKLKQWS